MSVNVMVHPTCGDGMKLRAYPGDPDKGLGPYVSIKLGARDVGWDVSVFFHDLAEVTAFAELVSRARDALVDLQVEAERKEHETALF